MNAMHGLALFAVLFILPKNSFAYLDPGTGSYFLQLAIGFFLGAIFTVKLFWNRIRLFFATLFHPDKKGYGREEEQQEDPQ